MNAPPIPWIAFYPVIAGLVGVVFWLGVLSNRVVTLEREARERKAADKARAQLERDAVKDESTIRDRLLKLETTYQLSSEAVEKVLTEMKQENKDSMSALKRELAGIQRHLANSMKPPVREFDPSGGEQP